jgi:hypothetical protein
MGHSSTLTRTVISRITKSGLSPLCPTLARLAKPGKASGLHPRWRVLDAVQSTALWSCHRFGVQIFGRALGAS